MYAIKLAKVPKPPVIAASTFLHVGFHPIIAGLHPGKYPMVRNIFVGSRFNRITILQTALVNSGI